MTAVWQINGTFTRRQDRATLESDLIGLRGLARRVTPLGVALFILEILTSLSLENTKLALILDVLDVATKPEDITHIRQDPPQHEVVPIVKTKIVDF